jgi:hypothetical protein
MVKPKYDEKRFFEGLRVKKCGNVCRVSESFLTLPRKTN